MSLMTIDLSLFMGSCILGRKLSSVTLTPDRVKMLQQPQEHPKNLKRKQNHLCFHTFGQHHCLCWTKNSPLYRTDDALIPLVHSSSYSAFPVQHFSSYWVWHYLFSKMAHTAPSSSLITLLLFHVLIFLHRDPLVAEVLDCVTPPPTALQCTSPQGVSDNSGPGAVNTPDLLHHRSDTV